MPKTENKSANSTKLEDSGISKNSTLTKSKFGIFSGKEDSSNSSDSAKPSNVEPESILLISSTVDTADSYIIGARDERKGRKPRKEIVRLGVTVKNTGKSDSTIAMRCVDGESPYIELQTKCVDIKKKSYSDSIIYGLAGVQGAVNWALVQGLMKNPVQVFNKFTIRQFIDFLTSSCICNEFTCVEIQNHSEVSKATGYDSTTVSGTVKRVSIVYRDKRIKDSHGGIALVNNEDIVAGFVSKIELGMNSMRYFSSMNYPSFVYPLVLTVRIHFVPKQKASGFESDFYSSPRFEEEVPEHQENEEISTSKK